MSKKARRKAAAAPTDPVSPPDGADTTPAPTPVDYYFLPDTPPVAVTEVDLRDTMKGWRHGRATRTLGEAFQDGYVAVFSVLMVGAMLVSVVLNAQGGAAACTTTACESARLMVPAVVVLALWALTLAVGRLFGPVLASAAEGFWLFDAPIRRAVLLRPRLLVPVVIAGVAAAVVGAVATLLVGMSWLAVVAWVLLSAAGAVAAIGLAAALQSLERPGLVRAAQAGLAGLAGLVLVAMVLIAAGVLPGLGAGAVQTASWWAFGLAAALAVIGGIWLAQAGRRLEALRRARLVSGGSLVAGMQGAMFALDFGLIRDILVERRSAERGYVVPKPGRGKGLTALIWRDLERLWREPRPLLGLAASVLVPYGLSALQVNQLNPLISGLALFVALVPLMGSLRVLTRSGGLARALPFKTSAIRTAVMVVPAGLMLIWTLAVLPAYVGLDTTPLRSLGDAALVALSTGLAGLLGAVRWVTAKKVDFGVPMLATETGAMPPTLLFNLFRGIDMVVLITAPLILQAPATVSLALAAVVFVVLRGSFSMDELKASQETALRERDEAKARATAAGQRITVPRPQRRD